MNCEIVNCEQGLRTCCCLSVYCDNFRHTNKSGLYVNNQESLLLFGYFFTFVSQADEIAFAFCVHVRVFLWRRVRKRNRVRVSAFRPTLSWSKATTTGRSIRLTATEFLASKREAPNRLTATQQTSVGIAVAVDVDVEQELPVACCERRCYDAAALERVACLSPMLPCSQPTAISFLTSLSLPLYPPLSLFLTFSLWYSNKNANT